MAEKLLFTLELKSKIDKELARVRRGTHAMSAGAVKDINTFQKKLGSTKNTVGGLTQSLNELRERKDRAFDTRQIGIYNRAIAKTERKITKLNNTGLRRGGMGGGAGGGLMGMASRFAGPAALGFAAFSLGKSALVKGAELEQNTIAFQTLLQDDKKGTALVDSVNKLANATPFANSALLGATRTLLNFGFTNEDVLPTMRRLGDVSGGNAERLSSLALVMGQVRSANKLMGQDLLQFINAGFNPLQEMAKTTGKSMAELKDEMSKGKITYDDVAATFQSVTSEGGKFYQMMEKQSESMGGKWSTLVGTLSSKMAELGVSMKGLVNPVLDAGIRLIGGGGKNLKTHALTGLNHYIQAMNDVNFSLAEREQLITQFNESFGEEVLGKTIDLKLALDSDLFLTELNKLKIQLENSQKKSAEAQKTDDIRTRKRAVEQKIEESKKTIFEMNSGEKSDVALSSVSMFNASTTDLKAEEETSLEESKKALINIQYELVKQVLNTGNVRAEDVKLLEERKSHLNLPFVTNFDYDNKSKDELEKINGLLKEFNKKTEKEAKKEDEKTSLASEKEKVGKLAASVNTGGKVSKTVNMNIHHLIGEMNNHYLEDEFDEEEMAEISIKGLLRAVNGAARIAEA